jgi:hypothetical protein
MQVLVASPKYSDLSPSNYIDALDWLRRHELVTQTDEPIGDPSDVFLAEITGEAGDLDSEDLPDPSFLPAPILEAACIIGYSETEAWERTLALGRKIDLERRSQIGMLGELAIVEHLASLNCEVRHVSLQSDGLGWDVLASFRGAVKHFEVKTTTSIARLRIYLTKHEYQVSRVDPAWVMLVVLISNAGDLICYAHVDSSAISKSIPIDTSTYGRWESCSIDLTPQDLTPGAPLPVSCSGVVSTVDPNALPVWWPTSG